MSLQQSHKDLFTRRWRRDAMPLPLESSLHIQLVAMLRWCLKPDVLMRHVPNGEHRDIRTAQKLKAMGVLPGGADLEFHWLEMDNEEKKTRLLHLELKRRNNRLSEAQAAFRLAVLLLGHEYCIATSVDAAIQILGERGLIRPDVTVCGRRFHEMVQARS